MIYTEKDYFEFLDALRNSGHVNMSGYESYLRARFSLSRQEAMYIALKWIITFDKRLENGEVSEKILKVREVNVINFTYEGDKNDGNAEEETEEGKENE